MMLSLIGMAGTGKSHWSSRLAEFGYRRFGCDELIAGKLGIDVAQAEDLIGEMGKWMGFPFEPQYSKREAEYLECERAVLREILETLKQAHGSTTDNIVVDTAGSVIYTGRDILERLKGATVVVHLRTSPEVQESMLKAYLSRPGPVLWRGLFSREPHETGRHALARCYPVLLSERERLYAEYADVGIDYHRHRREGYGVEALLKDVEGAG
jgi:shikimate kinase